MSLHFSLMILHRIHNEVIKLETPKLSTCFIVLYTSIFEIFTVETKTVISVALHRVAT